MWPGRWGDGLGDGARLSGAYLRNLCFDMPAGAPLRQPRVLSEVERAQLGEQAPGAR